MSCRAMVCLAWAGVATVAMTGVWSLINTWVLMNEALGAASTVALVLVVLACCTGGPRGRVAGLALVIATFLLVPWYALLARGEWSSVLVTYGGELVGLGLLGLAIAMHRAQIASRDAVPRAHRAEPARLRDRSLEIHSV
jgi:hypothetical protein